MVYKIDRLTRSLHDFSKLVEIFDKHEASFVSITQQFNTSTSMGRLTLNMLLSFAQFEREISGERVRDKKLAMVRKGLWTNGQVPHGYRVEKCVVSPDPERREEAILIFEKYMELQSVFRLKEWLNENNYTTRTGNGWQTGALYNMLKNPTYLGKIPYKGEIMEGNHEAIIPKKLFNEVQELLKSNNQSHKLKSRAKDHSLLTGLLYGVDGQKYYPSHSTKRDGRRYRYYLSKEVSKREKTRNNPLSQIPAQEVEEYVRVIAPKVMRDPKYLEYYSLQDQLKIQEKLKEDIPITREVLLKVYEKIIVTVEYIEFHVKRNFMSEIFDNIAGGIEGIDIIRKSVQLRRVNKSISIMRGEMYTMGMNAQMRENIRKSFVYNKMLLDGKYRSLQELCEAQDLALRHTRRVLNLRFLAGDILERILEGRVPSHWTINMLYEVCLISSWEEQRRLLNQ